MSKSPPAVTTAQAKAAATPGAQKELRSIADQVLATPEDRRDDRMALFIKLKEAAGPETKNFLNLTKRREKEHTIFMNKILPEVEGYNHDNRKEHDWSKDELFFLAAPIFFDGGLQQPDIKAFLDVELKRHYTLEAHHPEFELYNERECNSQDLMEMAVDRLARNVQYGNGIVDLEVTRKFLPKFPKGINEAKQEEYWGYVLKYKDFVQRKFLEEFPEAKEWSKK